MIDICFFVCCYSLPVSAFVRLAARGENKVPGPLPYRSDVNVVLFVVSASSFEITTPNRGFPRIA